MPDLEWKQQIVRAGPCQWEGDEPPDGKALGKGVEPWLAALLQAEHLGLLVGSGLTAGIAHEVGCPASGMGRAPLTCELADRVNAAAKAGAYRSGRREPNIEDQIRAAHQLMDGLRVLVAGTAGDPDPTSVNDLDQGPVKRLVPDGLGGLLRELPTSPTSTTRSTCTASAMRWRAPVSTRHGRGMSRAS
jgi:hypothetical protein